MSTIDIIWIIFGALILKQCQPFLGFVINRNSNV